MCVASPKCSDGEKGFFLTYSIGMQPQFPNISTKAKIKSVGKLVYQQSKWDSKSPDST